VFLIYRGSGEVRHSGGTDPLWTIPARRWRRFFGVSPVTGASDAVRMEPLCACLAGRGQGGKLSIIDIIHLKECFGTARRAGPINRGKENQLNLWKFRRTASATRSAGPGPNGFWAGHYQPGDRLIELQNRAGTGPSQGSVRERFAGTGSIQAGRIEAAAVEHECGVGESKETAGCVLREGDPGAGAAKPRQRKAFTGKTLKSEDRKSRESECVRAGISSHKAGPMSMGAYSTG